MAKVDAIMQHNFGTSFHNTTLSLNCSLPDNQSPANNLCKYGSRKVSIHNSYEGSLIQPSSPREQHEIRHGIQHEMFDEHLERIEWDFKTVINDGYLPKTANQRAFSSEPTDLIHIVKKPDFGPVSTWFWDHSMNVSCKHFAAPGAACRENQSNGSCETTELSSGAQEIELPAVFSASTRADHLQQSFYDLTEAELVSSIIGQLGKEPSDGPFNRCKGVQAFGRKSQQTESIAYIDSVLGEGDFPPGNYCSWPLGEKCDQVRNSSSDITRKSGNISRKSYLIKRWEELESYGNKQKEGSPEWENAWRKAYGFALQCAEIDYHFYLNMAKALTKGNQLNLAKTILLSQLGKFYDDLNYIFAVNKQLGFIYFKEGSFFYSLKYYMDGYSSNKIIPDKTYSYIRIALNRLKQGCVDDQFKHTAIRWFSELIPKKKANVNVAVQNVIAPMACSSPNFPVMSETALKWSGSGMDERLVHQWRNLERVASDYALGSNRWKEAWGCARDFALQCAKADYHFNLNAAIALTKLNHLEQAASILLKQLSEADSKHDQLYLIGVNKQLGFIHYIKKSYADSVYYYMQCIDGSKAVPDKIYKFISVSMEAMMDSVFPSLSFRDLALEWYHQLYPQSREVAKNK